MIFTPMQKNFREKISPFRLPFFRRIAIAAFVSGLGDALIPIAFAIESHHVEPAGWGFTAVLLALWMGRFAGMLMVRRTKPAGNPVKVMIASDLVRFTAQIGLLIWLLFYTVHSNSAAITILAFAISAGIYGIATAFFQPARFTAIPRIVPPEHLGHANSWLSVLGDSLAIIGPLAGSVILLSLGFKAVLLIDSLSFLAGIILLMGIKITGPVPAIITTTEDDDQEDTDSAAKDVSLPGWVNMGLISWLFATLTIGLLGVAGPTYVIDHNSALVWAVTAAFMATGSLAGSAVSLFVESSKSVRWEFLQFICLLSLAGEVLCFLFVSLPVVIWIAGFLGSALVTVSGIRWDTLGQTFESHAEVHAFTVRDQMVYTIGIPAGLLLFGLSATFNVSVWSGTATAFILIFIGTLLALRSTQLFAKLSTRKVPLHK